jgi:hypothetical protein
VDGNGNGVGDLCFDLGSWLLVDAGEGVSAHVGAGDGPFVVLLGKDRPDEPDEALLVREDADHAGSAVDLLVQAFKRIGGGDLLPVLGREIHVGKDLFLASKKERRDPRQPFFEPISQRSELLFGPHLVGLLKHQAHSGKHHPLAVLGNQREEIAKEVYPASLPARSQEDLVDGPVKSLVGVGDDEGDS